MSNGVVLGADEQQVFSEAKVKALLENQAHSIMNDQFVNLYFALIQLGYSERIKGHKSWSEDTATGLAECAHQMVSAAFTRLGKTQKDQQAKMAAAMDSARDVKNGSV